MTDKTIRRKIEAIKRHEICGKKVVSLADFRALRSAVDIHTILVIDEDEVMRSGIKRMLESEGYSVVTAEDGIELSRVLETTRLDLILLDSNLPWIDGIDLCRLIKSNHFLKDVPLVLISDRKSRDDIEKSLSAGADDYITRPFEIDTILSIVNQRLLSPILEDS